MDIRSTGYEYIFTFRMAPEIISRYEPLRFPGKRSFLFEIATKFILKGIHDENQIIDSERFDASIAEDEGKFGLEISLRYRLQDYWMTDDQIRRLIDEAFEFAEKLAKDPDHASRSIIPVCVGLDVCTVQQEGEPLNDTRERSICAEKLVPLYLSPHPTVGRRKPVDTLNVNLMIITPRIRVENVNRGLSLMQVCSICTKTPSVGAQISVLMCRHAFHSHCLFRSLEKSILCPVCHSAALPPQEPVAPPPPPPLPPEE